MCLNWCRIPLILPELILFLRGKRNRKWSISGWRIWQIRQQIFRSCTTGEHRFPACFMILNQGKLFIRLLQDRWMGSWWKKCRSRSKRGRSSMRWRAMSILMMRSCAGNYLDMQIRNSKALWIRSKRNKMRLSEMPAIGSWWCRDVPVAERRPLHCIVSLICCITIDRSWMHLLFWFYLQIVYLPIIFQEFCRSLARKISQKWRWTILHIMNWRR